MEHKDWSPTGGVSLEENADKALRHEGNVLIVAGPGAGKTELLAQKACYLFQTGICDFPHRILAVSFKVDSAKNLADRVKERCGLECGQQFTSVTFDAFAKSILDKFRNALPEKYRPTPDYMINDNQVTQEIIDTVCDGDKEQFKWKEKEECQVVALGGSGDTSILRAMVDNPDGERSHLSFPMVFSLALRILKDNRAIVESIRRTYKFVFIDEFQDTTALQYKMIEILFKESSCVLTAVGDSKQRIMLWAGAMKDAFNRFQNDFEAEQIQLLRNYRSAPKLVELQTQMYKVLGEDSLTAQPSDKWHQEEGDIKLVISENEQEEAEYLAKDIADAINNDKIKPEEICILSKQRVDKYAKSIMKALENAGIESRLETEYQDILSDPLIRLLIDCAYVALKDSDNDLRLRRTVKDELLNLRGSSKMEEFGMLAKSERELNELLTEVGSILESSQNKGSLNEAFHRIIEWVGIEGIRAKYSNRQKDKLDQQLSHLISKLHELITKAPSSDFLSVLDKLLGKDVIPIMTIHKSKGLEYHHVYLLGLEDKAFWSFKEQPEEDRCAFFVALSRAKASVTFTFSKYRFDENQHHDEINEFYDLLQTPGIAQVITL